MNYDVYQMRPKEWAGYAVRGFVMAAMVDYVFYRSIWLLPLCIFFGLVFPMFCKTGLKKKRKERLRSQFRDAILILSSSLNAGYSVENAFASSLGELDRIYGEQSMISSEIRLMLQKVRMNHTMEEAMGDFAGRSGLEDVRNFTEVFAAAHKSGGELMKIIAGTAEIIGEKIRIREEILTLTAAKRMEQRVMTLIPLALVLYIEWTSPGFFQILYTTMTGRIIMTVCLGIYLFAGWLSAALLEIEV